MGFNAATRNETRWSRGRSRGASSLGNGFHHKDAAAPHPPSSPTRTSRTNDNALQEVAATAHCVWLSHVPPSPPPQLFSQLPLLSASRLFEPSFPYPSASALVQTRLSSNYLCGRCSVGDASCNDNQERKREWARERQRVGESALKRC